MSDARSLLTVAVANPAAPADEYEIEAILFFTGEAASLNTLKVTVTNISGAGLCLTKGGRFKLDFARVPLAAQAVQEIKLSQPAQDWEKRATGTVLELIYQGADSLWDDGTAMAFTLDGIAVDLDEARAGTLTVEVDQIPALSNGMGEWKHPVLLARAPKVDLPSTVQAKITTKVLYITTTPPDIKNRLHFYLDNKGDKIEPASIEVSLACGTGNADLIGPHDAPPVLTVVKMPSGTLWGNIKGPRQSGDKLIWEIGGQDLLLQKDGRLRLSFRDIVTSKLGETSVKIRLNFHDYKDQSFILPITKEEAPQLDITSFKGSIEYVNGKPELVLLWQTDGARYCTIGLWKGHFSPNSHPEGRRFALQEPLEKSYTLTAYGEQVSLNDSRTLEVAVRAPEIRDLRIQNKNMNTGNLQVYWSTANAKSVHITLHMAPALLAPSYKRSFQNVGDSGLMWLPNNNPGKKGMGLLSLRNGKVTLIASGPGGEPQEKTIPWSYGPFG